MGAMQHLQAIRQYRELGTDVASASASPHQLVAMLLEGVLDRLARARGAARNGQRTERLHNVSAAISILEYLKLCLDPAGADLSTRLAALYDFCLRYLVQANAAPDPAAMIEEVAAVLRPIRQGWDELAAR